MLTPLLLTALVIAPAVESCPCPRVEAPCAAYWSASEVFVGRVDSVKRTAADDITTFTVLESFRGVTSSTIDVITTRGGRPCSVQLRIGHEYVVYARRADDTGRPTTSLCSRTRVVEDAAADLTYARALKQGSGPPGRISGRVVLVPRDLSGRSIPAAQPAPDIVVRVSSIANNRAETTVTNQAGDFAFENRGAGSYIVRVDVPDRYYSEDPGAIVELRDPRSCVEVVATLFDNGQVAGRVVDSSAQPVAGLTIELSTANGAHSKRAITDREGRYAISQVPPGRFVVGINTGPLRRDLRRQPRVYYPGAVGRASAVHITVAGGERVTLGDLRIPDQLKYVPVSGIVFDADGRPAEGARVFLKGLAEDDADYILTEPVTADASGKFVVAALGGAEYRLFAERGRLEGRLERVDSSEQVRLMAVEGLKPLRLTLQRRY
jgi:hypothetical protein